MHLLAFLWQTSLPRLSNRSLESRMYTPKGNGKTDRKALGPIPPRTKTRNHSLQYSHPACQDIKDQSFVGDVGELEVECKQPV